VGSKDRSVDSESTGAIAANGYGIKLRKCYVVPCSPSEQVKASQHDGNLKALDRAEHGLVILGHYADHSRFGIGYDHLSPQHKRDGKSEFSTRQLVYELFSDAKMYDKKMYEVKNAKAGEKRHNNDHTNRLPYENKGTFTIIKPSKAALQPAIQFVKSLWLFQWGLAKEMKQFEGGFSMDDVSKMWSQLEKGARKIYAMDKVSFGKKGNQNGRASEYAEVCKSWSTLKNAAFGSGILEHLNGNENLKRAITEMV